MNLDQLGQWLSVVDQQTKNIDCTKIPVEAEVHIALIRNKLAQIKPNFFDMIVKVQDIQYHYHALFEVLFSDLPQEPPEDWDNGEEDEDPYTDEEYQEIMEDDWEERE